MDTHINTKHLSENKKVQIKTVKKIRYRGVQGYNMLLPIISIIAILLFVLFFVFNAEHKTSVYLIYKTFDNLSVSTIIVLSFLAGNLFMLAVVFRQIHKKKKNLKDLEAKAKKKEEERISKIEDKKS